MLIDSNIKTLHISPRECRLTLSIEGGGWYHVTTVMIAAAFNKRKEGRYETFRERFNWTPMVVLYFDRFLAIPRASFTTVCAQ